MCFLPSFSNSCAELEPCHTYYCRYSSASLPLCLLFSLPEMPFRSFYTWGMHIHFLNSVSKIFSTFSMPQTELVAPEGLFKFYHRTMVFLNLKVVSYSFLYSWCSVQFYTLCIINFALTIGKKPVSYPDFS